MTAEIFNTTPNLFECRNTAIQTPQEIVRDLANSVKNEMISYQSKILNYIDEGHEPYKKVLLTHTNGMYILYGTKDAKSMEALSTFFEEYNWLNKFVYQEEEGKKRTFEDPSALAALRNLFGVGFEDAAKKAEILFKHIYSGNNSNLRDMAFLQIALPDLALGSEKDLSPDHVRESVLKSSGSYTELASTLADIKILNLDYDIREHMNAEFWHEAASHKTLVDIRKNIQDPDVMIWETRDYLVDLKILAADEVHLTNDGIKLKFKRNKKDNNSLPHFKNL